MKVCVFCRTQYKKGSGVTFHKFPTDNSLRLWLKNMKLVNWAPRECDFLCSKHFTENCFIRHHTRTALKRCSVPTIFLESDSQLANIQAKLSNDDCELSDIKPNIAEIDIKPKDGVPTTHEDKVNLHNISSTQKLGIKTNQSNGFGEQDNINVPGTSSNSTQCGIPKRPRTCAEICASVVHDHPYENGAKNLEPSLERVKTALKASRTRVKILSAQVKHLKISVKSLKRVIVNLKRANTRLKNRKS